MVATLEDHKDHATLLRAVPRIVAGRPGFRLSLVGGGSLRGELERLAAELNLGDAVRFEGTCTDVPERLGAADLFVLSTTPREGLGSVLLEALAAGLPVVATDVPACRETLAGGRWGDLVPPGDPAALATAILTRLNAPADPAARAAGAAYAAGFTPERMLDAYFALAGLPAARPAGGRGMTDFRPGGTGAGPTLALCWPAFGPYHAARLDALAAVHSGRVVGLETDPDRRHLRLGLHPAADRLGARPHRCARRRGGNGRASGWTAIRPGRGLFVNGWGFRSTPGPACGGRWRTGTPAVTVLRQPRRRRRPRRVAAGRGGLG